MITDPQTSPQGKWQQIGMSFCIVLIDLVLHQYESLSTLFLAGFAYFSGRLIWLHAHALWQRILFLQRLVYGLKRWATLGLIGWGGWLSYQQLVAAHDQITPNFKLVEIATTTKDISAQAGDVLERVDPRIAHIGKWVLSVGDAVMAQITIERCSILRMFEGESEKQVLQAVIVYVGNHHRIRAYRARRTGIHSPCD